MSKYTHKIVWSLVEMYLGLSSHIDVLYLYSYFTTLTSCTQLCGSVVKMREIELEGEKVD